MQKHFAVPDDLGWNRIKYYRRLILSSANRLLSATSDGRVFLRAQSLPSDEWLYLKCWVYFYCRSVIGCVSTFKDSDWNCDIVLSSYLNLIPSFSLQAKRKRTPWPESASELYRPSDRRLSVKLVSTFADTGRHVVSVWFIPTAVFLDI
jgi:hypothetical protein